MTTTNPTPIRTGATIALIGRARVAVAFAFATDRHATTTAWFGAYAGTTKHHRRPQEVPPH
jgi:hypothetical protein